MENSLRPAAAEAARTEGVFDLEANRIFSKTKEQIAGIRDSGKLNTAVLDYVERYIRPGVTTEEIDRWVHGFTTARGGVPAPLQYQGFPKSVCTSVNDVVCHGIPSQEEVLREGDIVNVDVSTLYRGYYSDSSRMFQIGRVSPARQRLVRVTRECVEDGLKQVKPGGFLGDVGAAVHAHARKHGYSVVAEIGGHGVGLEFHEEPFVSFVSPPGTGPRLRPGMVFTIEPMVNAGSPEVTVSLKNGWTVRTRDGRDSAQWEVTVLVTETGHEVLAQ